MKKFYFKKYSIVLLLGLCLWGVSVQAQLQVANWYFGNKAGLNFNVPNGAMPTVMFDGELKTIEGCSSISDEDGNLLFYTDGIKVYNRQHAAMNPDDPNNPNNTNNLFGDPSSSQSGIIVPNPSNNGLYYIFTVDANDQYPNPDNSQISGGPLKGFRYSIVDINLNGGLGSIITYNTPLPLEAANPNLCSEKVTAVRHFNQHDIWVITHLRNKFYAFLVTDAGVNNVPVVTTIAPTVNPDGFVVNARGYMKASPNGEYVAIAHYSNIPVGNSNSSNNTAEYNVAPGVLALYNFNNTTGVLSNYQPLDTAGTPYGVEFSPNSKFLYAEIDYNNQTSYSWTNGKLSQWKLDGLSRIDIVNINDGANDNQWPDVSGLGKMRGALQLGIDGRIYYSKTRIYTGDGEYDPTDIITLYRGNSLSVIYKPNLEGAACDFQVNSYSVTNPPGFNAAGDTNATNHYVAYGLPPFIASYFNNDVEIDVENVCENEPATFTLIIDESVSNITQIVWNMGDGTQYFDQNTVTHTYTTAGTYVVEVELHIGSGGLIIPVSIELEVFPKPEVQNATLVQCDGANIDGRAVFDLSLANDDIIINANADDFTIAYFLTYNDAFDNVNPLGYTYTNTTNPQTIFARVENEFGCFEIAELELSVVNELFDLGTWEVCDDISNNGEEVFNLSDLESDIYAQASGDSYAFYHSQLDSELDQNRIGNSNAYTNQSNPEYIYIRVFNGDDCAALGRIQLQVNEKPIIVDGFEDTIEVCQGTDVVLNPGDFDAYLWSTGSTNPTLTVTESGTYSVTVTNEWGCESTAEVEVIIHSNPEVQNATLVQCEDDIIDGRAEFRLPDADDEIVVNGNGNSYTVSYFLTLTDAQNNIAPLPDYYTNTTNPQIIYARIENDNGCVQYAELELSVIYEEFELPIMYQCDDESNDGVKEFDLTTNDNDLITQYGGTEVRYYTTEADAQADENAIVNPQAYPNQVNPQIVYIRVLDGVSCAALGTVELNVKTSPELDIPDVTVCPEETYTFDAGPGFTSYLWSTGSTQQSITVSEEGTYSVTVTNEGGCETTEEMTLYIDQPIITAIQVEGTTIHIIASGEEPLEYSIDLENWQESNTFTALPFGIFAAYVRDANGCLSEAKLFSILSLPNIITPNGDGVNDQWNVRGLHIYAGTTIEIYDRYGKLLKKHVIPDLFDGEVPGIDVINDPTPYYVWDGKYLGRAVPSTSYWYIIHIPDGRMLSGYLVVKNRNSIN